MHQDRRGYWYQSKREGSGFAARVVREYMGRGEVCELGARLEALDAQREREERAAQIAQVEEAQAQARALEEPLDQLGAQVKGIVKQVLEAHGYHLHARSQWRKRRGTSAGDPTGSPMSESSSKPNSSTAIEKSNAKNAALSDADVAARIKRARTEAGAAKEYLDLLGEAKCLGGLDRVGNMARQAENALLLSLGTEDEITKELWRRRMDALRRELGGDSPTPLEQMLVERVVLCWLHVHIVELTVAARSGTMTLPVAEYQQKRLDRAHKRHLSAMKALAQVRRLQIPAPAPNVQINVAREGSQVNAAQVARSPA